MRIQTSILSFLLLVLPCAAEGEEVGIERLLKAGASLYSLSAGTVLERDQGKIWKRISERDTQSLRCSRQTFFGLPVLEGLMRFDRDRLNQLELSLFNRGEVGEPVDEDFFEKLTFMADNTISRKVGRLPATLPEQRLGDMRINRRAWVMGAHRLDLAWSAKKAPFRAEYIRLRITPHDPRNDPYRTAALPEKKPAPLLNAFDLRKRVVQQPNGDIGLRGVPMVAQRKSYCAVATCERIMRYYGRDVGQDQLAEAADADRNLGTNRQKLIDSIRSLSRPLSTRFTVHYHLEQKGTKKLLRDYNREAGKAGKSVFNERVLKQIPAFYQHADAALLERARTEAKADKERFVASVKKQVDAGIPLMWTCMLGVFEEGHKIQLSGGHMRTIIGYNSAREEIIYSDTWGNGHEWKTMPISEAWTITTGLFSLVPDNIRP